MVVDEFCVECIVGYVVECAPFPGGGAVGFVGVFDGAVVGWTQ